MSASPFQERKYSYKFVPVRPYDGSVYNGVNWYVNSGTFFNFLKKEEDRTPRNESKEFPLCHLKYDINTNEINFTILPKPNIHIPKITEQPIWKLKKILFNEEGEPDPKGKFTAANGCFTYDEETCEYTKVNDLKSMYECYPKLTVYEFNYDFVMGMQLFDPTIVSARLLNMRLGVSANVNKSETAYQMRIAEIIKNIVESTAYEVSDCFYSFDNARYDAMLRDAELKRSRLNVNNDGNNQAKEIDLTESLNILNEFDSNATLHENKEVITRAFTQATATITDEVLPEDKYDVQIDIVKDLINSLTIVLVETILSPKFVLLYEVNRALMGQYDLEKYKDYDIEYFLKSIQGLIVSIVKEIRDIILQKLLDWVLKILLEINLKAAELIVKEQLEYYSRLMKLLFKACSFKKSKRADLDSELDNVDYADIDEIEKPKESNC